MHTRTKQLAVAFPFIMGATYSDMASAQLAGPPPNQAAAITAAEQDQRTRQQQEARERAQAIAAPGIRAQEVAPAVFPELPTEAPCFRIQRFELDVPPEMPSAAQAAGASALPQDPFAFARAWLDHYQGECVGQQGVQLLVKGISQAILDRGYVTTRVLVPEQDLSTGTLRLTLIPGLIGELRFAEPDLWGTWRTAFPTRSGELLNLRDLEQGLEQMKRVSSQDVDMQVVPTATPGGAMSSLQSNGANGGFVQNAAVGYLQDWRRRR